MFLVFFWMFLKEKKRKKGKIKEKKKSCEKENYGIGTPTIQAFFRKNILICFCVIKIIILPKNNATLTKTKYECKNKNHPA